MITGTVIFAIVLWLAIGLLLTIVLFSQMPFVDGGLHFIPLWPIVLNSALGPFASAIVLFIYGVIVWGSTYLFRFLP